jgi:protein gp37
LGRLAFWVQNMGKDSEIEWTNHTFNPWWGCEKVSPACSNCYAEAWAKRVGCNVWGKGAERRFFGEKHWNEPLVWNADAKRKKNRPRVFCASMADVFEARDDLNSVRTKLFNLIADTAQLDWLLLTKRPENIGKMVPWKVWPANVWLGTTVESQEWAEKRLPHLLTYPAAVRFLSCEPLLGPIDLAPWVGRSEFHPIDWVIAGGESGARSRPMELAWVRNLRDFCKGQKIAFHFKQWGHWIPESQIRANKSCRVPAAKTPKMIAMGKKEAGRVLDGKTYDGFPMGIRL